MPKKKKVPEVGEVMRSGIASQPTQAQTDEAVTQNALSPAIGS
jgi:hypothetical protein